LPQWLKPVPEAPEQVVAGLERVLLFLKQQQEPSKQARQVASLAFAWGAQVVRATPWRWMSVSEDGSVNPALVSPDRAKACLPVDVVTMLAMKQGNASLSGLYRCIVEGQETEAFVKLK
jgi:hypothetical protein